MTGARAGTTDDVLATYRAFAEAQNARDPARFGAFFVDGPELLWGSDGKTFWGREAILARIAGFQKAATWRVEPDLDRATILETTGDTALLHMPLIW